MRGNKELLLLLIRREEYLFRREGDEDQQFFGVGKRIFPNSVDGQATFSTKREKKEMHSKEVRA